MARKPVGRLADLSRCNSWQEYVALAEASSNSSEKGKLFEVLTKHRLILDPRYSTQLKTHSVWLLDEVPHTVRKKLRLPDTDEGIDLVAETKNGEYWAIQCKYHSDPLRNVTRREVATFLDLALGRCRGFSLALIATTADGRSYKFDKLYDNSLTFLPGEDWRSLNAEFFSALRAHLQGKAQALTPLSPRPHQVEAISAAIEHFSKDRQSRGKLIMPCATGKSLTAFWMAQELGAKRILIAVPSLALVKQTIAVWARELVAHGKEAQWIAVCSDDTVGDVSRDDLAYHTYDLGVRIHTDPEEIARWLRKRHDGLTIVFTTYQSGRATAEAARLANRSFDLGLFDEAHKTVGKAHSQFAHLLSDGNISIKKRLFMTATERRYGGRGGEQILSMEDPRVYGSTFHMMSFREAIEADPPILTDYKIVTMMVSRSEIAELIQEKAYVRPDKGKWDDDLEAQMLAGAVALRKAMNEFGIKHAVSFHSSISRARAFKATQEVLTETFPEFGALDTYHVSGSTPTAVRSRELDAFASADRSLVTNARCLTEGVDVPGIDCVLFSDPKKSTIDIVQAVGRAIRLSHGKKFGYVLIPVLIEDEMEFESFEQTDAYSNLLTIVRSLASNDSRVVEYFRERESSKSNGRLDEDTSLIIDCGVRISSEMFFESLKLKLWASIGRLNWRSFGEAREFAASLGLRTWVEWLHYCDGMRLDLPEKPSDIPTAANATYRGFGWISIPDWLGTDTRDASWEALPYDEAKEIVHTLKIPTVEAWRKCVNKFNGNSESIHPKIPHSPSGYYKGKGWVSWNDWLGTTRYKGNSKRDFEQAKRFVHKLGLSSATEWAAYCRGEIDDLPQLPLDIPKAPKYAYKGQWVSMGDWLGTGRVADQLKSWRCFPEARIFARSLRFNNMSQWRFFIDGKYPALGDRPSDLPKYPERSYKGKWLGAADWLGTNSRFRKWRSFEHARSFARSLHLNTVSQWRAFCSGFIPDKGSLPHDIPRHCHVIYKQQGWDGWPDFLGTGRRSVTYDQFLPYSQAREFVRKLKIRTVSEYREWAKGTLKISVSKPPNIPSDPVRVYSEQWVDWHDWLGTIKDG